MPGPVLEMPPLIIPGKPQRPQLPPCTPNLKHVFIFPRDRIADPSGNVLMVANLWGFGIGSATLLCDHRTFLRTVVAPLMGGISTAGARLIGLASRSGSAQFNLQLGLRRAKNAKRELEFHLIPFELVNPPFGPMPRNTAGSQGENFAARMGVADGKESANHRAVLLTVLFDRRRPTQVTLKKK
jgi:hypothetical protein